MSYLQIDWPEGDGTSREATGGRDFVSGFPVPGQTNADVGQNPNKPESGVNTERTQPVTSHQTRLGLSSAAISSR